MPDPNPAPVSILSGLVVPRKLFRPQLFVFPEKGGSTREAKRVCLSCDVRSECLEYALAHDERFGIWGGLSERERRRLKRRSA